MSLKRFSFESLTPEEDGSGAHSPALSLAGGTHAEAPQLPPPPPSFSEAELEAARKMAYEEGFMAGKAEGKREVDHALMETQQQTQQIAQKITQHLAALEAQQQEFHHEIQPEIGRLVLACSQQLAVEALRAEPLADIQAMAEECLALLVGQPEVVIQVHPKLQAPLAQLLGKRARVVANAEMNPVDCQIQWHNGEAVRNIETIWGQIEETITRYFAPTPLTHTEITDKGEDHGG